MKSKNPVDLLILRPSRCVMYVLTVELRFLRRHGWQRFHTVWASSWDRGCSIAADTVIRNLILVALLTRCRRFCEVCSQRTLTCRVRINDNPYCRLKSPPSRQFKGRQVGNPQTLLPNAEIIRDRISYKSTFTRSFSLIGLYVVDSTQLYSLPLSLSSISCGSVCHSLSSVSVLLKPRSGYLAPN